MRLAELEEMMNEEPDDAEAAIAELVSEGNVDELSAIATRGRVTALKLRAIDGLGDIGGGAAMQTLVEMLETASEPFKIGGTEQRLEHQAVRGRLVRAVARASGVEPPTIRSQQELNEFIESCRRR